MSALSQHQSARYFLIHPNSQCHLISTQFSWAELRPSTACSPILGQTRIHPGAPQRPALAHRTFEFARSYLSLLPSADRLASLGYLCAMWNSCLVLATIAIGTPQILRWTFISRNRRGTRSPKSQVQVQADFNQLSLALTLS